MPDNPYSLPSSLSDEAIASLLRDLPAERPIPTFPNLSYSDFLVRPPSFPIH